MVRSVKSIARQSADLQLHSRRCSINRCTCYRNVPYPEKLGNFTLLRVIGARGIQMRLTGHALPRFCLLVALLVTSGGTALADVTDAGTYTTSVDVDVPSFHGITPIIRLNYDSNAGDGPLGVGWSLSVGSQITRASRFRGAPRFDATDQFWLDGLELLPCVAASLSASCRAGGTYTTRIETYARIRLDEASNTWTLWRPNGTRCE
jgi:hypothetical protein